MQEAAAPGPAMGGFAAATGTFHHSGRGAAAQQQFQSTLLALQTADCRLDFDDNPSSSIVARSRVAHRDQINQADNLEAGRQVDRTRRVIRILWVLIRDQVSEKHQGTKQICEVQTTKAVQFGHESLIIPKHTRPT